MTQYSLTQQFLQKAFKNIQTHYDCHLYHGKGSCQTRALIHGIGSAKRLFPMYLMVHLIPFLLFKLKKMKNKPFKQLSTFLTGLVKSVLFSGGYSYLTVRFLCLFTRLVGMKQIIFPMSTIGAGLALIFQPVGRQSEIALFTVNKSIQTAYNLALRRKLPVKLPYGQCIVMGLAMAILCYHFYDDKQCIKPAYRSVIQRLLKER